MRRGLVPRAMLLSAAVLAVLATGMVRADYIVPDAVTGGAGDGESEGVVDAENGITPTPDTASGVTAEAAATTRLARAEQQYAEGIKLADAAANEQTTAARVPEGEVELTVDAQDLEAALALFLSAAEQGHAPSQEEVGLRLLSGLGAKVDVQRAVLYLYFAAAANQSMAQLALGYRHMHGLGVPKSCSAAVLYYLTPAERVVESARGPAPFPGIERIRLSVDHDATYNPAREQEMVQYFQYTADMGNVDAQTAIGQLFNLGSRGIEQDFSQAFRYFTAAAEAGDMDATAHLGHLYANGLGVQPDNHTALEHFRKGAAQGHGHALYGLGYMYLAGAGVEANVKKAVQYFSQAADHGSADAHFHLAVLYVTGATGKADYSRALQHFNSASHAGHLMAVYNLALMHLTGLGIPVSCPTALALLKSVAERGLWSQVLQRAHAAFLQDDTEGALRGYLRAAEMGLEVGQSNAAYLLERRKDSAVAGQQGGSNTSLSLSSALHYHQCAADQGNIGSLLRIGDAHYYGRGTPVDLNKSVAVYRQATQLRSAQAMFNLAVMHEHGWGLSKDLHLAKRFYDMAESASADAMVPVMLAKVKLTVHIWIEAHRKELEAAVAWAAQHGDSALISVLSGLLGFLLVLRRNRRAAA